MCQLRRKTQEKNNNKAGNKLVTRYYTQKQTFFSILMNHVGISNTLVHLLNPHARMHTLHTLGC